MYAVDRSSPRRLSLVLAGLLARQPPAVWLALVNVPPDRGNRGIISGHGPQIPKDRCRSRWAMLGRERDAPQAMPYANVNRLSMLGFAAARAWRSSRSRTRECAFFGYGQFRARLCPASLRDQWLFPNLILRTLGNGSGAHVALCRWMQKGPSRCRWKSRAMVVDRVERLTQAWSMMS